MKTMPRVMFLSALSVSTLHAGPDSAVVAPPSPTVAEYEPRPGMKIRADGRQPSNSDILLGIDADRASGGAAPASGQQVPTRGGSSLTKNEAAPECNRPLPAFLPSGSPAQSH